MPQMRKKEIVYRPTLLAEAIFGSIWAERQTIREEVETADPLPRGKDYPEESGRQLYSQYRRSKGGPGLRELGPVKGWPRTNQEEPGTDAWRGEERDGLLSDPSLLLYADGEVK